MAGGVRSRRWRELSAGEERVALVLADGCQYRIILREVVLRAVLCLDGSPRQGLEGLAACHAGGEVVHERHVVGVPAHSS